MPEGTPGARREGGGWCERSSPAVPSARNNVEAAGEGTRKGGAGASRRGDTKEPSTDCHLRVTESAPPLLPFFPLFLQLWASESLLCAQMLSSNSRPLCGGATHQGCSNLWRRPEVQGLGRETRSRGARRGEENPRSPITESLVTRTRAPLGIWNPGRLERLGARSGDPFRSSRPKSRGPGPAVDLG